MRATSTGSDRRGPIAARVHDRSPISDMAAPQSEASGLRHFERDQEIFGESDPADFVYEVVAGIVRTYKLLSDGRRQIAAFYLPGDLFGMEVGQGHRFSAEAIKDVTVRVISRRRIEALAQGDRHLAARIIDALARSLERAQDHMLLLGRKCAREKVASFLLGFVNRMEGEKAVELPMSRIDIADHLGLTIETVSRTLTQLQREGLIDLPSARRVILLRDLAALRQLDAGDQDSMPARLGRAGVGAPSLMAHRTEAVPIGQLAIVLDGRFAVSAR